jgi:hypothetical protein
MLLLLLLWVRQLLLLHEIYCAVAVAAVVVTGRIKFLLPLVTYYIASVGACCIEELAVVTTVYCILVFLHAEQALMQ